MSKVGDIHHGGLIGSQPQHAEASVQAKISRTEEGFSTAWLITPAPVWLILFLVIPLVSDLEWKAEWHLFFSDVFSRLL